jgi:mRNA interferase MazF
MKNNLSMTNQRFTDWARLKLDIQINRNPHSVYFKDRQIWWVNLGQNIGSEQNGKHKNFERPVLVFKKFNPQTFLAIPLSSQIKHGPYSVVFERNGIKYTANLSQIRVLSSKRLLRLVGKMSSGDYKDIKFIFKHLV